MPCFTRRITDDQLVVGAYLHPSGLSLSVSPENQEESHTAFNALIDTGATGCGLSADLARQIGALPIGKTDVFTANGVVLVNLYLVDVHVLMEEEDAVVTFSEVQAVEFPADGSNVPVILGMDLIRHGSLHIAGDFFTFAL